MRLLGAAPVTLPVGAGLPAATLGASLGEGALAFSTLSSDDVDAVRARVREYRAAEAATLQRYGPNPNPNPNPNRPARPTAPISS